MTSLSFEAAKEELKKLMKLGASAFQSKQARFKEIVQAHPELATEKYEDAYGEDEKYPLHQAAAFSSSTLIVEAVFDAYPGAIKEKDKNGFTPVHFACRFKQSEQVIRFLVEKYPEALEEKKNGWTPLHLACWYFQSEQVIRLLVEQYPQALKETRNGWTPLNLACRQKQSKKVIRFLAETYPQAVKEMNEYGKTPLDYARNYTSADVIELLTNAEQKLDPEQLWTEASTLYANGNYEAALDKYMEARKLRPIQSTQVWMAIASCHEQLLQFDDMASAAKHLIDVDPAKSRGYYLLAVACSKVGNVTEALEAVEAGLLQLPSNESLLDLKDTLEQQGKEMAVQRRQQKEQEDTFRQNPLDIDRTDNEIRHDKELQGKLPAVRVVGERRPSNAKDSPRQQEAAVIRIYNENKIAQTMALLQDLQGSDVSISAVKDMVEILGKDVDLFQSLLVELKSTDFACNIQGYQVELTELLFCQRESNEDTHERQCIQQSELDYEFYLHLQWKLRSMIRASECLASGMVQRGRSPFRDLLVSVVTEDGFVEALNKINLVKTLSAGLRTAMRQFESVPGMHAARKVVELVTEFREKRNERLSVARVAVFSVLVEIRGGPSGADLGVFVERVARLMVRARARCLLPRKHAGGIRNGATSVMLNILGDISTSSGGQQGSKAADELFRIIMGPPPPEGSTFAAACGDASSNIPLDIALVSTLLNVSIEDLKSLERFSLDSDDGSGSVLAGRRESLSFAREASHEYTNPSEYKETSGTAVVTREELEAWTKKQEEHDKVLRRLQSSDDNGNGDCVVVNVGGGMKQVLIRKPPSDEQETGDQHLFELQKRCLTLETLLCELMERFEQQETSQDECMGVLSKFARKKGKQTVFARRSRSS